MDLDDLYVSVRIKDPLKRKENKKGFFGRNCHGFCGTAMAKSNTHLFKLKGKKHLKQIKVFFSNNIFTIFTTQIFDT